MKRKKPARKLKLKKQQRPQSYKALKAKAWSVFSLWVRTRGMDSDGFNVCVTCGIRIHWNQGQAGHFIDGRHNAVLFHPDLVHFQCLVCNVFKHGNKVLYTRWMQKKYGVEACDQFLVDSKKIIKLDRSDLEAVIKKYS